MQARPSGLVGPPSARASRSYRVLLRVAGWIGHGIFGFRIEVHGRDHLPRDAAGRPAGGWIAAGLPHRTWVDPFVLADVLPIEPRLIYFGDGRAIFRSRWRRAMFGRIGGIIPIWPGRGREGIDTYIAAARAALDAGGVLCLFPETGPATPPGTARTFGLGLAYFALRSEASIVPIVLGGTHELYRGRRFRMDIQPAVSARLLASIPDDRPLPAPWTAAERQAARAIVTALHARMAGPVSAAHAASEPPPGARKRWRWLTIAWH